MKTSELPWGPGVVSPVNGDQLPIGRVSCFQRKESPENRYGNRCLGKYPRLLPEKSTRSLENVKGKPTADSDFEEDSAFHD
jgi:hypothetical protein